MSLEFGVLNFLGGISLISEIIFPLTSPIPSKDFKFGLFLQLKSPPTSLGAPSSEVSSLYEQ